MSFFGGILVVEPLSPLTFLVFTWFICVVAEGGGTTSLMVDLYLEVVFAHVFWGWKPTGHKKGQRVLSEGSSLPQ